MDIRQTHLKGNMPNDNLLTEVMGGPTNRKANIMA